MNPQQSLRRGLLATAGAVFASLFLCLAVSPEWLTGWGTVVLVAMVPAQIVISLVWQSAYPAPLAALPQPLRGLAFCALNALVGGLVALAAWQTVGGGLDVPTPFLIMFLIFAVPVALMLVIALQCWPFAGIARSPGGLGAMLLIGTYGVTTLLFRWCFDFGFLAGAPFYRAALDPQGLFMAWTPLVFSIACVVPLLWLVFFDFWPLTALTARFPTAGRQPVFGLLALAVVGLVAWALWLAFVGRGMDPVVFMVRICVALNFGCFIVLVLFEGLPMLKLPQPWRGLVLTVMSIVPAVVLPPLYETLALGEFALAAGGPAYPLELWLASAMLAVTFPLMVVIGSYFQFWPLGSGEARALPQEQGAT